MKLRRLVVVFSSHLFALPVRLVSGSLATSKRVLRIGQIARLHGSMAVESPSAIEVAQEFWRLMMSNDFSSVSHVLAPEFLLEWPQSKERFHGVERFARVNQEYPSHGPWRFKISRIFGTQTEVVSDVEITDGVQHARAISFFTVEAGKIIKLVEYWPEPYPAPANRAHLVETM